jgi:hypothetical protein
LIKGLQRNAALPNPNMAGLHLVGTQAVAVRQPRSYPPHTKAYSIAEYNYFILEFCVGDDVNIDLTNTVGDAKS